MAASIAMSPYISLPKFFFDTCRNEEKNGTIKKNEVLARTQAQRTAKNRVEKKKKIEIVVKKRKKNLKY